MAKTIYVGCPFCEGMMEVDPSTGEVLQKWPAGQKTGADTDRMAAALKKIEDDKKKRASLFEQKRGEMEGQKKKIEDAFKKEVERVKKEGVDDKPLRPFDLD